MLRRERRGRLDGASDWRRCCIGAVWTMRVGPSQPPCRGRLQTTARCGGQEPFVLSVAEKASCQLVRYEPRRRAKARAREACRSRLPTSAGIEHAQETASGRHEPWPIPDISAGSWRTVLVDSRGPYTVVLFAAAHGAAELSCFSGRQPMRASLGGSFGTHTPPPVPAGHLSIVSSGSRTTPPDEGSQHFSELGGRIGPGVTGVTLRLRDGKRGHGQPGQRLVPCLVAGNTRGYRHRSDDRHGNGRPLAARGSGWLGAAVGGAACQHSLSRSAVVERVRVG